MDQQVYYSPEEQDSHHVYYNFQGYLDDEKIEEAEFQFNDLVANQDWSNLSKWGQHIIKQNKRKIEDIQIPFGFDANYYYSEYIQSIKGVILSRLAYLVSKPLNKQYYEQIVKAYQKGIGSLNLQPATLKYFLPQLLNASRSLLAGQESAYRSVIYTENMTVLYNLDTDREQIFQQLLEYFKSLLQTKLFEESISIIQNLYKERLKKIRRELAIQYLNNIEIEFVSGCWPSGKVSFQGMFINHIYAVNISSSQVYYKIKFNSNKPYSFHFYQKQTNIFNNSSFIFHNLVVRFPNYQIYNS